MHRRLQAPLFARFAAGGADAGKTGAPNSKLSSTRATALAIALAASAPISTAPPAGAATTNTATDTTAATADSSRATSTTQKLTSGYMAADQETVADNPVTSQVTAMLATDTTRQCANQRTCDAAGQVSSTPADNAGTGRLRTNRQRGHVALDHTVESSSHYPPSIPPPLPARPVPGRPRQPTPRLPAPQNPRSRSAAQPATSAPPPRSPTEPVRFRTRCPTRPRFRPPSRTRRIPGAHSARPHRPRASAPASAASPSATTAVEIWTPSSSPTQPRAPPGRASPGSPRARR